MKFSKYFSKYAAALLVVYFVSGCKQFDLDINQDPNNPTTASPELLLTQVQYSTASLMSTSPSDDCMGFMGLLTSNDLYDLKSGTYNGFWITAYTGPLKDIEGLIAYGDANNAPNFSAVAKILKSFIYVNIVDLFNDAPFSEASQGDAATPNKAAKFDKAQDIYNSCHTMLDEAITALSAPSGVALAGDVIYGGGASAPAKWVKFAKTLKMKMYMTTRLVDPADASSKIREMLSKGGMFAANADDFKFDFGKTFGAGFDNRHPWYQFTYSSGSNGFYYISHQLMIEMLQNKDPRFPFYFRRQTDKVLNQNDPTERGTTPCATTPGCYYGYVCLNPTVFDLLGLGTQPSQDDIKFLAGIFGRDRSDPAGVPQDPDYRTLPGAYPAGGYYDTKPAPLGAVGSNKAPGGGVWPALSYFNLLYYQVEAALALGVTEAGDPRANFEAAMRANIKKVSDYGTSVSGSNSVAAPAAEVDAYVADWLARYDAATDNNAKMDVVMKQLWFSSWGNGYEIYNAYRRTGYPSTLQAELNPVRGFPYRLPYPSAEIQLNDNATSYEAIGLGFDKPENKVFWDKN